MGRFKVSGLFLSALSALTVMASESTDCPSTAGTFPAETAEVKALLGSTEPLRQVVHCIEHNSTCRKLVLLKDKATGEPAKSFYMVFASLELNRQTGATEYFIANPDGTYHSYLDDVFDGVVDIDTVAKENQSLKVDFKHGLPNIYQTLLIRHGTCKREYAVGDLTFAAKVSTLTNAEVFKLDGAGNIIERKPLPTITYLRRKALEPALKK